MIRRGDRIVVGVSGGPDSTALLACLVTLREALRLKLHAAYLDHGLRPLAARQEAVFVRRLGHLWGIPVAILKARVKKKPGESLEAIARQVRYQALANLARRLKCSSIALGHTRDDQAETVLMWMLRGTGSQGLTGIPPVREVSQAEEFSEAEEMGSSGEKEGSRRRQERLRIIRPLIEISRSQVQAFLKSHGIKARRDTSNDSLNFLRNRIRKELIPFLERYNPQVRRHLSSLAKSLREDREWLEAEVERRFKKVARLSRERVKLDRNQLRLLPVALRKGILQKAVEFLQGNRRGFAFAHWEALDRLLTNGQAGSLDLPHTLRAELHDGRLFLRCPAPVVFRG